MGAIIPSSDGEFGAQGDDITCPGSPTELAFALGRPHVTL